MPDESILIESGDADDAENVDAMLGHPALVDYVHPLEQFTVTNTDPANNQFDMSAGKAFVGATSLNTSDGDERRQLMLAAEKPATSGISIQDPDAKNYVYLDLNLGTNSAQWTVNTTGNAPNDTSLLVVTLEARDPGGDGTADRIYVAEYNNRAPDVVAEALEHPDGDAIDLAGTPFANAGYDDVDVPSTVSLVTDDFERAAIGPLYDGHTSQFDIQDSTVLAGTRTLRANTDGDYYTIYTTGGQEAYPEAGDSFRFHTQLENTEDRAYFYFGIQNPGTGNWPPGYLVYVRADTDQIKFNEYPVSNSILSFNAPISDYLGEKLTVEVVWGKDGHFEITLLDSDGNELGSDSGNDTEGYTEGIVQYGVNNNANNSSTAFFDGPYITRRTREYTTETQRGYTEVGNEPTSRGGSHVGPLQAAADTDGVMLANQPVSDDLSQGDPVGYALSLDEDHALEVAAEADGQGGIQNGHMRPGLPMRQMKIRPDDAAEDPSIGGTAYSLLIRAPDSTRGIVLQNQDDSQTNGEGKASIYWYSDAEESMTSIVAHPDHEHLSIYTKNDAIGTGDTGLEKRFNLGMGSGDVHAGFTNVEHIEGKAGQGSFWFEGYVGQAGSDVGLRLYDENDNAHYGIYRDGSQDNDLRIYDLSASTELMRFRSSDQAIVFNSNELRDPKTEGSSTDPRADQTPDDYMHINIGGTLHYVPLYT